MTHIILCGDSIFDNQRYVQPDERSVTQQVQRYLRPEDHVTMLACDGSVTTDIAHQFQRLPDDATHLFVSVGGNDALRHLDVFSYPVKTVGDALLVLSDLRLRFEQEYAMMLQQVVSYDLPLAVCTIYYPRFRATESPRMHELMPDLGNTDQLQDKVIGALALYNDIITKVAFHAGVSVLDLRILCDEDNDFANPIEPSENGGEKIARLICHMTKTHHFSQQRRYIFF